MASADRNKPNQVQTRLRERQYEVTVPVIMDRCHQNRAKNALEPEWEARFEARSYGFVRHEVHGIEGGERPLRRVVAAAR
jgi:hypothetical protein